MDRILGNSSIRIREVARCNVVLARRPNTFEAAERLLFFVLQHSVDLDCPNPMATLIHEVRTKRGHRIEGDDPDPEDANGLRPRHSLLLVLLLAAACGSTDEEPQPSVPATATAQESESNTVGELREEVTHVGHTIGPERPPARIAPVHMLGRARAEVEAEWPPQDQRGRWVSYSDEVDLFYRGGIAVRLRLSPCNLRVGERPDLHRFGLEVPPTSRVQNARDARVLEVPGYHVEGRNRVCTIQRSRSSP